MKHLVLPPESPFSRAVYQAIRPRIPRDRWPMDNVWATVQLSPSGTWLEAKFDGFSDPFCEAAAQMVRNARVELILKSPLAHLAGQIIKAKRWRDTAVFGSLPALFAIPFMGSFGENAMKIALLIFCADIALLAAFQGKLSRIRQQSTETKFVAHIPAPGFKFSVGSKSQSQGLEDSPEV